MRAWKSDYLRTLHREFQQHRSLSVLWSVVQYHGVRSVSLSFLDSSPAGEGIQSSWLEGGAAFLLSLVVLSMVPGAAPGHQEHDPAPTHAAPHIVLFGNLAPPTRLLSHGWPCQCCCVTTVPKLLFYLLSRLLPPQTRIRTDTCSC